MANKIKSIKEQIANLLHVLNTDLYEREEQIKLALLASLAGESIFMLGPPGVAKSLIARRLKHVFKGGKSFEYLMNRFSTPDEIFGPVSISKLKEDQYERQTEHYLPGATIVFLDEIWKAGPSIQNALLTVINEKVYRNGAQEEPVKLKALISASNELPAKGEGLEALWDRFLIRTYVDGVRAESNFFDLLTKPVNDIEKKLTEHQKIDDKTYKEWAELIPLVEVPEEIIKIIQVVRFKIQEYNNKKQETTIYVSDRRWRKIVRLMRASAFFNDRVKVDLMDAFLIQFCIWDNEKQIPFIQKTIQEAIENHGYSLSMDLDIIKDQIKSLKDDVKRETSFLKPYDIDELVEYDGYYHIPGYDGRKIKIEDYNGLNSINYIRVRLYYNDGWQNRNEQNSLKKSSKLNFIVKKDEYYNNSKTYKLETQKKKGEKEYTKKPHEAVSKEWDKTVQKILTHCNNYKEQIDTYKNTDLKHIYINLFLDKTYAAVVDRNLSKIIEAINTLELDVKKVQDYYSGIKGQREIKKKILVLE